MLLPPALWPSLAALAQADPARPEGSVLRPLLYVVIIAGLVVGLLRFFWHDRRRGG